MFVLTALGTTATARAEVTIDWARGVITAPGIGLADRQAPNPAVARGPSRRRAEEAARRELAAAVPALPLAAGGTVATASADAAVRARVDQAIAGAITLTADPETDGSWQVTMAVPLEAIRIALAGPTPRQLPQAGDRGAPVLIVDDVPATIRPALGYTINGTSAPCVWVTATTVPAWATRAPRAKASAVTAGGLTATGGPAKPAPTDGTVFVLVVKSRS